MTEATAVIIAALITSLLSVANEFLKQHSASKKKKRRCVLIYTFLK